MKFYALIISLLVLAAQARAQDFHALYGFPHPGDGGRPETTMLLDGNILYGTTSYGTIFKITTDGSSFVPLRKFPSSYAGAPGDLIVSGNTLYGMGKGSGYPASFVYRMNTDGSNYTQLTTLSYDNASYQLASLLLIGDTLYGTAAFGANWSNDVGIVFKVTTNGTGYQVLHTFSPVDSSQHNSEGAYPKVGLISDSGTLYGTCAGGGSNGYGTVFKLNIDGSAFTVLHRFVYNDGVGPWGRLLLRDDTVYGTTAGGGSGTLGTIFKMNTNGTGFTVLHSIPTGDPTTCLNCGARGSLALIGNTLYGTSQNDGASYPQTGSIFKVNTDGSGFAKVHVFSPPSQWNTNSDGDLPLGGLVASGNTLYGTAAVSGPFTYGTIFALDLPCSDCPPLISSIAQTNGLLAFNWTANSGSSYQIQYSTDPGATNWNNLDGVLVATNSIMSTVDSIGPDSQRFYRVVLLAP